MFVAKSTGSPSLNLPRDTNFNSTVLLLHGDGVVNANNTMFVNNSGANTYIPFNGTSSYYFNGSSAFTLPAGSLDFLHQLTADWTFECWFYYDAAAAAAAALLATDTASVSIGMFIRLNADRSIDISIFKGSSGNIKSFVSTSAGVWNVNVWNHFAATYDNTTGNIAVFINGTSIAGTNTPFSGPPNSGTATYAPEIGRYTQASTAGGYFVGYISNMRIVNGTRVYTSNFTPSTSELSILGNTRLLTAQLPTTAQSPSTSQQLFKDNSPNNLTITTVGTPAISTGGPALIPSGGKPAQGTFSPFSTSGYSLFLNTATDYINFTPTSALTLGNNSFTMECWCFFSPISGFGGFSIVNKDGRAGTNFPDYALGINSNYTMYAYVGLSTGASGYAEVINSTGTVPTNQWNHLAYVRNGLVWSFYCNGVYVGGGTQAQASTATNNYFHITSQAAQGAVNQGSIYLNNLRIIVGDAIYNSNFTPPSGPLPKTANTQLLLFQNSNTFKDNSNNNYALTLTGTPSSQAFTPLAPKTVYSKDKVGGSVFFSTKTDSLDLPGTTDLTTFTGNFTIESWVYPTDTSLTNFWTLYDGRAAGATSAAFIFGLGNYSSGYQLQYFNSGTTINSTGRVQVNTWSHVALERVGTTVTFYINGQASGTFTLSGTLTASGSGGTIRIGSKDSGLAGYGIVGYISNYRITNGTAAYNGNFTPSTAPFTSSSVSNTKLLLNATNPGIIDNTGKNNLKTFGSGSYISNTQSKFGISSIFLSGTTSYMTIPFNEYFNIPINTPFTFECWVYTSSTNGFIIANRNWAFGSTGPTWGFVLNNGVTPDFGIAGTGSATYVMATSTISGTLNQWNHYAWTRDSSNNVRIFVNGLVGVTRNDGQALTAASGDVFIGVSSNLASAYASGFIDDLRFTKGYARYTANFTPPTRSFENR